MGRPKMRCLFVILFLGLGIMLNACKSNSYDILLHDGLILDGSGSAPYRGDVAINGDVIAAIGDLKGSTGKSEIDLHGLAVAPGFINMLSWATDSLLAD